MCQRLYNVTCPTDTFKVNRPKCSCEKLCPCTILIGINAILKKKQEKNQKIEIVISHYSNPLFPFSQLSLLIVKK